MEKELQKLFEEYHDELHEKAMHDEKFKSMSLGEKGELLNKLTFVYLEKAYELGKDKVLNAINRA